MSEDYYLSPEPQEVEISGMSNPELNGKHIIVGNDISGAREAFEAIMSGEIMKDDIRFTDILAGMEQLAADERYIQEVYNTGMRIWAESLSVMTRQRRRANARERMMRMNEWPKNREPRAIRRKQVLASIRTLLQMEAAHG